MLFLGDRQVQNLNPLLPEFIALIGRRLSADGSFRRLVVMDFPGLFCKRPAYILTTRHYEGRPGFM